MMVFEDNDGGADDNKDIVHAKRLDLYINEKEVIIKSVYYVEVVSSDGKQVLW